MELFAELAQVKTRNKQLSATIAEQAKELAMYKAGNVPVQDIINDSEALAMENEEQASEIERQHKKLLELQKILSISKPLSYLRQQVFEKDAQISTLRAALEKYGRHKDDIDTEPVKTAS